MTVVALIEKLATVFADNRIVRTINSALVNLIPFVLVGALFVAVLNLPFPAYQEGLDTLFSGQWRPFTRVITFASLGSIALATLVSLAYTYASDEPSVKSGAIHPIVPTFTALACYVVIFVWDGGTSIDFSTPGRAGVFSALATALVAVWLFFRFVALIERVRPAKPSTFEVYLQMRPAFHAIFPTAATLVVFALVRVAIPAFLPVGALQAGFDDFVSTYLISDNFGSVLLTVFLTQFIWFFGAHGSGLIIDAFPIIGTDPGTTQALFASRDFYLGFVSLGGTGTTCGLLIALFLIGSRHRGRRLAKASLFPSLLNVNEPLLYCAPLILNPYFVIPFMFAPLLAASLSFVAFSTGFVPPITEHLNWTTPIFFSGYLSTGSPAGAVLQLVSLIGSTLLYIPFTLAVRNNDRCRLTQRIDQLQQATCAAANDENLTVLWREDAVGKTARELCAGLGDYFKSDTLPFHLVYQPKTTSDGAVMGTEALLRWEHPEFGSISPVVLVELCDESGLTTQLGRWITKEAIAEYARWKRMGIEGLGISINLNTRHLGEDREFPEFLAEQLAACGIEGGEVELEITERTVLLANAANKKSLAAIRDLGVELSIDDMGMGYSSLSYISDFGVKAVKIDASLITAITTDVQQQEIIRSIVSLAEQLDLTVVVEGVEVKEQVDTLSGLGVLFFQGFYFSKPRECEDFLAYVRENGIYRNRA